MLIASNQFLSPVHSVDFSQVPERPLFAAGFLDETINIWKTTDGTYDLSVPLKTIEEQGLGVVSLGFNYNWEKIASTSLDSKIRIYSLEDGMNPQEFRVYEMDALRLWKFDFHPKTDELIYGTLSLNILNIVNEESKSSIEFKNGWKYINSVKFNNEGVMWAWGDIDGVVELYKIKEGAAERVMKFEDHGLPVRDLSYSKDDAHLVSVSDDQHINLIDATSGKRIQSFTGHQQEVLCCWFNPNGKYFATGSADKSIKIWDLSERKCVNTIDIHDGSVWSIKFSPDGRYLVSGSEDGVVALTEFK